MKPVIFDSILMRFTSWLRSAGPEVSAFDRFPDWPDRNPMAGGGGNNVLKSKSAGARTSLALVADAREQHDHQICRECSACPNRHESLLNKSPAPGGRCPCGSACRRSGSSPSRHRRGDGHRRTVFPSAVTPSTRPPSVTSDLPSSLVPLWKTFTSGMESASAMPVMGTPVGYSPGYPLLAATTQTAGRWIPFQFDLVQPSLATSPVITSTRSLLSRIISGCVSGSPKRQLNSRTLGPLGVIIRPAYSTPGIRFPRGSIHRRRERGCPARSG